MESLRLTHLVAGRAVSRGHGSSVHPSPIPVPKHLLHLLVLSCVPCNKLVTVKVHIVIRKYGS
jgi:hypothetical protein